MLDEEHQGSQGHQEEYEQDLEIMSVEDSYSSDDANLQRIKKPGQATDVIRMEDGKADEPSDGGVGDAQDGRDGSESEYSRE